MVLAGTIAKEGNFSALVRRVNLQKPASCKARDSCRERYSKLVEAHGPDQDYHRQAGRSTVEQGADVQADKDNGNDTDQMREVETVKTS